MTKASVVQAILPHILRAAGRMERQDKVKGKLYWIFHRKKKKACGPYSAKGLSQLKFFRPEARVAPYRSYNQADWKPAKSYPELLPYLKDKK